MIPLYLILILITLCQGAEADTYEIRVTGRELPEVTAVELKLGVNPPGAYILDDDFQITYISSDSGALVSQELNLSDKILYKLSDSSNLLLRFFLMEPIQAREYILRGNLKRGNFGGKSNLEIKAVDYIADFASGLDLNKLKTSVSVKAVDDVLPFIGISKAEILGPDARIFSPEMFVVIGNIETYGFTLNQNIGSITVNGKPAKLIHGEVIAANLTLPSKDVKHLPIVLEMEVDNRFIKKEIGSLKIKEPIE